MYQDLEQYKVELNVSISQNGTSELDQRISLINFLKRIAPNCYIGNEMASRITNNKNKKPDINVMYENSVVAIIETKKFGSKLNIHDEQSTLYLEFAKALNCTYLLTNYNEFIVFNNNTNNSCQKFTVFDEDYFNKSFCNSISYEEFINIFNRKIELNFDNMNLDYNLFLYLIGSITYKTVNNIMNSNISTLNLLINNIMNALNFDKKNASTFLVLSVVSGILSSKNKEINFENISKINLLESVYEKIISYKSIYKLFNVDVFINLIKKLDKNIYKANHQNILLDYFNEFDDAIVKDTAFYQTPNVIVKGQANMTNFLLKDKLKYENGLLDQNINILDPSCGRGIYLEQLLQFASNSSNQPIRSMKSCESLSKRLYGFEINPAMHILANMDLTTKYPYYNNNICLTDTLSDKRINVTSSSFDLEINRSDDIKKHVNFKVIIGNIPFNKNYNDINQHSDNIINFIEKASEFNKDGKYVVSYVVNRSLLYLPSYIEFRSKLFKEYNRIYIVDTNGDKYKDKKINDRNIFENQKVTVGVAIIFLVKDGTNEHEVYYYGDDIIGSSWDKLRMLNADWSKFKYKKIDVDKKIFSFCPVKAIEKHCFNFELDDIMKRENHQYIKKVDLRDTIEINDIDKYDDYTYKPFVTKKALKSSLKKYHSCDTIAVSRDYFDCLKAVMFPIHSSAHSVFLNLNTNEYPLYINNKLNINDKIIKIIFNIYQREFDPKDIFYYIAGRLNSYEYNERFVYITGKNMIDFIDDFDEFKRFVQKGKRLFEITKFYRLNRIVKFHEEYGDYHIEKFCFKDNKLYINEIQYLYPVTQEMINFSVGTYKPLSSKDNIFKLNIKNRNFIDENNCLTLSGIEYLENVLNAIIEIIEIREDKKFEPPSIIHEDVFELFN